MDLKRQFANCRIARHARPAMAGSQKIPEMSAQKPRVVCIGEVMIELARGSDGRYGVSCSGDAFNTAIYLARAGLDVAFASALGDDPYSEGVLALAEAEGIKRNLVLRAQGRLPGIMLVDSGPSGERRTFSWRETSPARDLFELAEWPRVAEALLAAGLIYFSGITLSLYSNIGIGRLIAVIEMARKSGAKIAFDCNFRPLGWKGDLGRARAVFIEALKRVDVALPTFDDEAVLWGDPSPEATAERLQAFGIGEIVVKNGANSALVAAGGRREHIPVPEVIAPVDPMAAGDSFNAAYLAARLAGDSPGGAVAAAHQLAGEVIRHRGAIIPRAGAAVH
jgi:2-dehydro-3-deoxygluconokinase